MKRVRPSFWLPVLFVAAALGSARLNAQTFFTEDFSDNSAGPNMALGAGHGSPTTDFTGDFTITSGANSRIYLGTNDTNYSTTSFTYDAIVTVPNTTNPWAIAFFGMGNPAANGAQFGEPTVGGVNALINLRNDNGNLLFGDNTATTVGTAFAAGQATLPNNTHGLRMTWNAATQQAVIGVDVGNTGNGYVSTVIDGSNNGFNAANSQLLLGGGNGLTFDNVAVSAGATSPTALLFDIDGRFNTTQPVPATADGSTYVASGVAGDLSDAIAVSAAASATGPMTAGGVTLDYVNGVSRTPYNVAGTSFATNALLNDYLNLWVGDANASGPVSMEISGLADGVGFDLEPNFAYELYLFGTAGSAPDQNALFTFDGQSLESGVAGVDDPLAAIFEFTTGPLVDDTLTFQWERIGNNEFASFNGFAIVRAQQVPEPVSLIIWSAIGIASLGLGRVRRRGRRSK